MSEKLTSRSSEALDTIGVLALCWQSAGRLRGTLRSFDFWVAVLVWACNAPFWWKPEWPAQVIGVLPNLLGFTLAGFSVFLSFGNAEFQAFLARSGSDKNSLTPYISTSAAFLYFVAAQIAALLYALAANGLFNWSLPVGLAPVAPIVQGLAHIGSGVGYFLFIYSLALALRAAIRIFRLSRWYGAFIDQPIDAEDASMPAGLSDR